jgi:DNA-binding protein HU-beta
VKSSLRKDEMVTLVGFGTFYAGKRAARTGATRAPARRSTSRPRACRSSALARP